MTVDNHIYTTNQLLGVMREFDAPTDYWLTLGYGRALNFDTEWIEFDQITTRRKLAPLVVPTAQGKPIYERAETVTKVKPAYVKPKDPVSAARMIKRAAGLGELNSGAPMSPAQRYLAIVADIAIEHRDAIMRRWEWLASEATQHAAVTLEDDAYPLTVVDFMRDAGHSVTLGVGARWGDAGVSVVRSIEAWRSTARRTDFGGRLTRMTMGTDVWDVVREDEEIRELLRLDIRNTSGTSLNLGLLDGDGEVEFVGRLASNLELYVYSDYYEDDTGAVVEMMSPKDVVLTGDIGGIRCFGAILDKRANFQPMEIFPKMYDIEDPSATNILTQSAPLMVPTLPNRSFRATVLAP